MSELDVRRAEVCMEILKAAIEKIENAGFIAKSRQFVLREADLSVEKPRKSEMARFRARAAARQARMQR